MLPLILAIAAFILGAVAIVQSRGQNLAAWGVCVLAALHLLGSV